MEPFEYDDYSDFDAEELDFDPPPRVSARRNVRQVSPFDLEVDEDAMEKLRCRARQATTDFLDSCDAIRHKAKSKDEDALKKIDAAIDDETDDSVTDTHLPLRRSSIGQLRSTREGSLVSEADVGAKPPIMLRPLVSKIHLQSSGLPPRVPNVMDEINALEAFGRDKRPLREKAPPSPVVFSRFARSVTPGARFRTPPRASPVRSGSQAPRAYYESVRASPRPSTEAPHAAAENDVRERISTRRKLRDVESRLDKILDFELPSATGFKEMRSALRDINDKMTRHRLLIDRYSGLQMHESNEPVAVRVNAKVEELVPRVPALSRVQNPFRPRTDEIMSTFDPRLIPGYSTGICVTPNEGTSELRGRIRGLLCRTRETSKRDSANPHLKPLQPTSAKSRNISSSSSAATAVAAAAY